MLMKIEFTDNLKTYTLKESKIKYYELIGKIIKIVSKLTIVGV